MWASHLADMIARACLGGEILPVGLIVGGRERGKNCENGRRSSFLCAAFWNLNVVGSLVEHSALTSFVRNTAPT